MKTDLVGARVQRRNDSKDFPGEPKMVYGKIRGITSKLDYALIDWGKGKLVKTLVKRLILVKEEGR